MLPNLTTRSVRKVKSEDIFRNINVGFQGLLMANYLTADKTVNFTAVDTAATIQAAIDAEPKNLNGYVLTFQFADGTYSLNAIITFQDFFGGEILIQGNMGENQNALHTNQAVILNNTNTSKQTIDLINVSAVSVYNLKLQGSNSPSGIWLNGIKSFSLSGLYMSSVTNAGGQAFNFKFSTGVIQYTYITLCAWGIRAERASHIYSSNNNGITTNPDYGLASVEASTIGKNGTQPPGVLGNEVVQTGGVIR